MTPDVIPIRKAVRWPKCGWRRLNGLAGNGALSDAALRQQELALVNTL